MSNPRSEASKRGRRSKSKGKAFEKSVGQDIAKALGLRFGITADCDVTTTRSGQDDCDIGLSQSAKMKFPFWVECKNQKTLTVPAWLEQVRQAQKRHKDVRVPCIVFKEHGSAEKHAIIPFNTLLKLIEIAGVKEYLHGSKGFIFAKEYEEDE